MPPSGVVLHWFQAGVACLLWWLVDSTGGVACLVLIINPSPNFGAASLRVVMFLLQVNQSVCS